MIVAIALAALAVVVAVVMLAAGLGGELADTHPDHPPLPLPGNRPIAGTDAALLRLPLGVWGYHTRVTDEALRRLSYALTERDTRIAILEQQAAELRQKLESLEAAESNTRGAGGTWRPPDGGDVAWTSPSAESLELGSHVDSHFDSHFDSHIERRRLETGPPEPGWPEPGSPDDESPATADGGRE